MGDIEFWAPNRGLLITAGDPPTVPPGIWVYNGAGWHVVLAKAKLHIGAVYLNLAVPSSGCVDRR